MQPFRVNVFLKRSLPLHQVRPTWFKRKLNKDRPVLYCYTLQEVNFGVTREKIVLFIFEGEFDLGNIHFSYLKTD